MDLQRHYDSFLQSLKEDVLEGSQDFAKKVPIKDNRFNTASNYFSHICSNIRTSIKRNDAQEYFKFLTIYRDGLVRLFEKMVDECVPSNSTIEKKNEVIMDKGFNWFKFSDVTVDYSDKDSATPLYRLIPRYAKRFLGTELPVVSMGEMVAILNFDFNMDDTKKLIALKKRKKPEYMIVTGMTNQRNIECWSQKEINKDYVREWTLKL